MLQSEFLCDKCGLCCMNLHRSELYSGLNRGDGICTYFNLQTNLCNIYKDRPLICRVDEMYKRFFHQTLTLHEFYQLNINVCDNLKESNRRRE